jgi:hypothetical protein
MPHFHHFHTDPDSGVSFLTVYLDGDAKTATTETHDNFADIVQAVMDEDPGVMAMFSAAERVAEKFRELSERVTVSGGTVYFDGDPVHNTLTEQILRFLKSEDEVDWMVLVDFFENVMQNPVEHSREQLYDWLRSHDVTLTDGGHMIAYKGVYSDGNGGYRSGWAGRALVNGVSHSGSIPYAVGDLVTMPRSEVIHDPQVACAPGLHVGTFNYARSYAQGAMLKVLVNPRDVVSVPEDQKVRVCRFEILEIVHAPVTDLVDPDYEDDEDDFEDFEF